MKKKFVLILIMVLIFVFVIQGIAFAQEYDDYDDRGKEVSVFVGLGYAFSDYEGPVLDLGIEFQFSKNLYGLFLVDYYTNPSPTFEEMWDTKLTITGINIMGAYKFFPANSKFNIALRAGIMMTARKAKSEFLGGEISNSTSDFGVNGGLGLDYAINERFGLLFGGCIKVSFEDETAKWFKIYSGVSYRIK
jgi:outer membrane protein with beta-barrel domain